MPYFVFLEFTDPQIRNFILSLQNVFSNGEKKIASPHITIRGPYETQPEQSTLNQLNEALQGYGVLIGGAGTFETKNGYAVYLKVQSPVFSDLWWKPDFNTTRFGINPHLTIFESTDRDEATAIERFLRAERIEIFTLNLSITVYLSKQLDLFEVSIDPEKKRIRIQYDRVSVKKGLIQRAETLKANLLEKRSK